MIAGLHAKKTRGRAAGRCGVLWPFGYNCGSLKYGIAMNKRKACLVGLTVVATLLAGCVAQYRNPSTCEDEMRNRLAETSLGTLSVADSAVAYRGQRVVVEGHLNKPLAPASGASAASAAAAASGASAVSVAEAASEASAVSAASGAQAVAPRAASSAAAASGVAVAAAASGASGASAVKAEPKPSTPVAALVQKLGIKKPVLTPAAAECMFNESGLVSFRWLAPPELAKTTPDPHASDN
jgi:hypothetical protein